MKLEIDFEVLKVTEMSADDYMFLFLIYRKGFNYLSILNLKPNISDLKENGYLEVNKDNLGFLQNLEVWINNYTWEKYENLNDYAEESKHSPRNTRSL